MSAKSTRGWQEKTRMAYAIAATLSSISWGIHYTFITRYISVELGGGSRAMTLYNGLDWGLLASSVLSSLVARFIGERRSIFIGLLTPVPTIVLFLTRDPFIVAATVPLMTVPWSISQPVILKTVFSRAGSSYGREYGWFTIGTGVGWLVGSLLAGPLYMPGGLGLIYTVFSILIAISCLLYYSYYTPVDNGGNNNNVSTLVVVKTLKYLLVATTLVVFSRELLYAQAPVKIDSEIHSLLGGGNLLLLMVIYGLVYSGGAIISPVARILAGQAVDRCGALRVLVATTTSYIILYWSFTKTSGLLPLVLWQIPLFPFLDVSLNAYIAETLPPVMYLRGFSLVYIAMAMGGLLLVVVSLLGLTGVDTVGLMVTLACLVSITLSIMYEKTRKVDKTPEKDH